MYAELWKCKNKMYINIKINSVMRLCNGLQVKINSTIKHIIMFEILCD